MAVRTSAMTHFRSFVTDALAHEEAKRGLGKQFHSAVMLLLEENPNKTNDELSTLFVETMNELASSMVKELEGKTLAEALPSFKQYFSDYKRGLELMGYDIRKCGGIADVKSKKAEILAAMKEKNGGGASTDENPAAKAAKGESTKGDPVLKLYQGLAPEVQEKVSRILEGVAKLDSGNAVSILAKTESIVWGNLKAGNRRAMIGTAVTH